MVCRVVGILCEIDVKAFGLLCIVIICSAKELDRRRIMKQAMKFGEFKVSLHSEVNKNLLIFVESCKAPL